VLALAEEPDDIPDGKSLDFGRNQYMNPKAAVPG
jgi:hypothetical protein